MKQNAYWLEAERRRLDDERDKGTRLRGLSQEELDEVARKLNTRPRKTLDYDTPADRLEALLH